MLGLKLNHVSKRGPICLKKTTTARYHQGTQRDTIIVPVFMCWVQYSHNRSIRRIILGWSSVVGAEWNIFFLSNHHLQKWPNNFKGQKSNTNLAKLPTSFARTSAGTVLTTKSEIFVWEFCQLWVILLIWWYHSDRPTSHALGTSSVDKWIIHCSFKDESKRIKYFT